MKKTMARALNFLSAGFPENSDLNKIRKVYLLTGMLILGIFFTGLLGTVALNNNGTTLGIVDYILLATFLTMLILLRKQKNINQIALVTVVITGVFFLYLVATGGINKSAFLWSYSYPLISFFLLGWKRGIWASLVLLFFSTLSFILSPYFNFLANYDTALIIRFIPSYFTVTIFAFFTEKVRETIHKKLLDSNNQLKKADELKTDLINMTIHDLKNPLNTIRGAAELLNDSDLDEQDSNELIEIVEKSSDSMLQLINSFLEASTLEDQLFKLDLKKINLSNLLSDEVKIFEPAALKKEQTISQRIEKNLYVLGDEHYTSKIFENVISNAIKYSPLNSEITIELYSEGENSIVKISDKGEGFSDDDKLKAFTRFSKLSASPTAGEDSNGLGLFIVKTLVDLHNGKVWIESEKMHGTDFFIQLPLA